MALIAPPEPPDPLVHDGVFGAHYDVSRLAWLHSPDPIEEWLARSAHPAIVDLVLAGKIALEPFVEQRPLSSINEVFEEIHHGRAARRVILVPES